MIQIISHRGYWNQSCEKNSLESFENALTNGFGIETDLRDFDGNIIISHDMPKKDSSSISIDKLFQLYNNLNSNEILALNIKSDGLSNLINNSIKKYNIKNYFFFDMSVPDMLHYKNASLNFFTRHSDIELEPTFYSESSGVWLDELCSTWISEEVIEKHYSNNKNICIVSPELHGRPHKNSWEKYKKIHMNYPKICLCICTDYPEKARRFFEQ